MPESPREFSFMTKSLNTFLFTAVKLPYWEHIGRQVQFCEIFDTLNVSRRFHHHNSTLYKTFDLSNMLRYFRHHDTTRNLRHVECVETQNSHFCTQLHHYSCDLPILNKKPTKHLLIYSHSNGVLDVIFLQKQK